MADSDDAPLPADLNFEKAIARLEEIVARLDGDPQSLEASLKFYEEGVVLARYCMQRLGEAALRVQELALE